MNIFDTIFPNHTCLVCKGEINQSKHSFICNGCADNLPYHKKVCDKCGSEVSMHAFVCDRCKELAKGTQGAAKRTGRNGNTCWRFAKARSAFCYQSPIVELVLSLKYNAEGDVAKFVAPFLANTVKENNLKADVIIPVPLAPKRLKQRGYNQAGLLAAELSKIINVPVLDDFLFRTKHTEAQKQMKLKERQENLHDAFEIRPPYTSVKGKNVLLIDDVFTTGTTANECARVIKKAKPKSIIVLTIASVSHNG